MDSLVHANKCLLSAAFVGVGSGIVALAATFVLFRLSYNYGNGRKLLVDDCEEMFLLLFFPLPFRTQLTNA